MDVLPEGDGCGFEPTPNAAADGRGKQLTDPSNDGFINSDRAGKIGVASLRKAGPGLAAGTSGHAGRPAAGRPRGQGMESATTAIRAASSRSDSSSCSETTSSTGDVGSKAATQPQPAAPARTTPFVPKPARSFRKRPVDDDDDHGDGLSHGKDNQDAGAPGMGLSPSASPSGRVLASGVAPGVTEQPVEPLEMQVRHELTHRCMAFDSHSQHGARHLSWHPRSSQCRHDLLQGGSCTQGCQS